jgi:adenylate cyclase
MKKRITADFFIPGGVVLLFAALTLTGILMNFENRIFDAFLTLRKSPPENPSIVLVDIEDQTISAVGTWPISRNITADGLMLLRELGAEYAVFDIDYIDKSPNGVNSEVLSSEIPETLSNEFETLKSQTRDLFAAISSGRIPVR